MSTRTGRPNLAKLRDVPAGRDVQVAVGDFNRDGFKDLALASDSSRVHLMLGTGDGTFPQQQTLTFVPEDNLGMDNTDIAVGDFNGDTIEDSGGLQR